MKSIWYYSFVCIAFYCSLIESSSLKRSRFLLNEANGVMYDTESKDVYRKFTYGTFIMKANGVFVLIGKDSNVYVLDRNNERRVFINNDMKFGYVIDTFEEDYVAVFNECIPYKNQMKWWKEKCEKLTKPQEAGCCLVA